MPSIKVYGARMGSSFRVHWALAEAGLAYESMPLDMRAGEHKQPAYLAINPAGQVPAMVYDGFVLAESSAIARYIAEKHLPALLGATPESRANGNRWEIFTLLNIDKNFSTLAGKNWGRIPSEEAAQNALAALGQFLPVIDGWLSSHQWVNGEEFSVSDIVVRSTFMYAALADYDLTPFAAINAWIARCDARPAFAQAKG